VGTSNKGKGEQTSRENGTCVVLIFSGGGGGGARKSEVKFLSLGVSSNFFCFVGRPRARRDMGFRAGTLPRM
jgi:hypothetical protein